MSGESPPPAVPDLTSRIARSPDVLVQELDGEAVLLNLESERYFGLDPVGTRVWALLEERTSLDAVHETLLAEFEVEPERLRADLLQLVGELAGAGLVTVDQAPGQPR